MSESLMTTMVRHGCDIDEAIEIQQRESAQAAVRNREASQRVGCGEVVVLGPSPAAVAFFLGGWRNKLDLIRSRQHVDSVCGVKWGDSYRTHMAAKRARCWRSIRRLTGSTTERQPQHNTQMTGAALPDSHMPDGRP